MDTLTRWQLAQESVTHVSLIYSEDKTSKEYINTFSGHPKFSAYAYRSSRNPLFIPHISFKIRKILSEIAPDIIHLHSTFPGVYVRFFSQPAPIVYCAHGWSFIQETGWYKKWFYTLIEKYLSKKTEAIINISLYEHFSAHKKHVCGKINRLIYNGVSDRSISQPLSGFQVNPDVLNLGFVGRLDYKKGFDIIERFFREKSPENVHLYVMGKADRDKVTFLPSDNIHYLGWIDKEHIDSYIQLLDAVIIPSRHEGFGFATIEAMRNYKPVIVSDKSALPEIVIDGFNGHVFTLEAPETLFSLIKGLDKKALIRMGKNARAVYEFSFMEEIFCSRIFSVYQDVLQLNPSRCT